MFSLSHIRIMEVNHHDLIKIRTSSNDEINEDSTSNNDDNNDNEYA